MAGRRSRFNEVPLKQLILKLPPSTKKLFELWAVGVDLSPSELLYNLTMEHCPEKYRKLVEELGDEAEAVENPGSKP
jgi:hypothetical protein